MLEEKDFILDSCKVTPGFEFYPKKRKKIDLGKLKDLLTGDEIYISKDNSPFYLHIKTDLAEVTVFSSLKIIIKDLVEEDKAKVVFNKVLGVINRL
ncbi:MAG: hypothetical protein WCY27_03625 [archaeon]|jgi:hypothetical protein|nr:hypothetical protein [archaeon]MDD2477947.1 hypothetical protein [Candidatus ainarchaeum sp.]MDD3084843.1 hypothetical protein [Candidatus ainarchaeum sp.]MDD4221251.1 hypothetical protein [Candidatus ainarchaeum sp.]MDD4662758.1 hypothetical protein [Candidatus ainarchaeum sp.]